MMLPRRSLMQPDAPLMGGGQPPRRRLPQQGMMGPQAPPPTPIPGAQGPQVSADPQSAMGPGNVQSYLHANPEMMQLLQAMTGKG